MGLFEKVFGKQKPNALQGSTWQTLTAYRPQFTTWSGSIYESELVRAAINARATHVSKLSVSISGSAKPALQTKLRRAPNAFQTWSQYFYRLCTILDMCNTAFIVPVFGEYGDVTGMFPVLPSSCAIVEYKGEPWLQYKFRTGKTAAVELSACGIMTKFQFEDDIFGTDNKALIPTMQLINIQNQGISEGIKNAATYRFMAQMSNFSKTEDLAKFRKDFSDKNLSGEAGGGGLLLFPNTMNNIQQISSKPFVIDEAQMSSIRTNVFNYFGVNEDILQNKAFGDAWSAFYEGAVEPFAIQWSEVVSRMLFSPRERAEGSVIMATSSRLQYMTNEDKLNVSAQMADRGLMTRNEIREIWNLAPLPDGIGDTLPVRGEYYNLSESEEQNNDTV